MSSGEKSTASTIHKTLLVVGVVTIVWLAWQLADVLLLFFAAILFAVLLRAAAMPIERWTPLGSRMALVIAGLALIGVVAGFLVLLGTQIQAQISTLSEQLPEALTSFGNRFGIDNLPQRLIEQAESVARRGAFTERILGYTSGLVSAVASALLVLIAGLYLAAGAERYRDGLLRLIPKRNQPKGRSALENLARALRLWLLGQLISMLLVGTLTTIGLYVLGIPTALALGVIAGVLGFVPYVGPVVSAVPAVLLALSEGGTEALWVIGLYIVVQQIESNLIMPLVQRKVVDLPPVLMLFAILAFGVLFGPLGVLLGTPLAVVVYVLVMQLYVRDALHHDAEIPGDHS